MKIGLDARFVLHDRRGIGNYGLMLIKNLVEIAPDHQFVIYADKDDESQLFPRTPNVEVKHLEPALYPIWEQVALPRQAEKDCLDLLHCTGITFPLRLNRRIKLITSIHDVMFMKDHSVLPPSTSLYQRAGKIYRKLVLSNGLHRVDRIITISEFSKHDILAHFPQLRSEKITVTYLGYDSRFHVRSFEDEVPNHLRRIQLSGEYIFMLGGIDPRKNTELLIRTFVEIKREYAIKEKLVIAGVPNWRNTTFFEIARSSGFHDDIVFTDFLTDEGLAQFYSSATLFAYPSLYEGFGLPLLEAMASGVPVLTSNVTSMPEIAGDAALMVDPRDPEQLKAGMMSILRDRNKQSEMRAQGLARIEEFSWAKMAAETLEVYKKVVSDCT